MDHHSDAGQGPVVVDIGGDVGALILVAGPDMAGQEIEITRVDGQGLRTHVEVHRRRTPRGLVYAAVYPGLREGQYLLWPSGGSDPMGPVDITGGRVTEVSWSQLVTRD